MSMRYRLQRLDGSTAEGERKFLCHLAVAHWILFPDNAPQILTTVLNIRLDKDLEVFLLRRIDIWEGVLQ